jgi:hypothetical protein
MAHRYRPVDDGSGLVGEDALANDAAAEAVLMKDVLDM